MIVESLPSGTAQIPDVETAGSNSEFIEPPVNKKPPARKPANKPASKPVRKPAPKRTKPDADADGVADDQDACLGSPKGVPVAANGCLLYNGVIAGVSFAADGLTLDDSAKKVLNSIGADLKKYPDLILQVQVWATQSTSESTLLARKRTLAVIRYLLSQELSSKRLKPANPIIASVDDASDAARGVVVLRTIVK